jgi:hypothetical protein
MNVRNVPSFRLSLSLPQQKITGAIPRPLRQVQQAFQVPLQRPPSQLVDQHLNPPSVQDSPHHGQQEEG